MVTLINVLFSLLILILFIICLHYIPGGSQVSFFTNLFITILYPLLLFKGLLIQHSFSSCFLILFIIALHSIIQLPYIVQVGYFYYFSSSSLLLHFILLLLQWRHSLWFCCRSRVVSRVGTARELVAGSLGQVRAGEHALAALAAHATHVK